MAEAELAQAEAQLTQSRADFERTSNLFKEGVIPKQQLDAAQAALLTAESARDAANQRLALAREGSRRQDIAEAEAHAETGVCTPALAPTYRPMLAAGAFGMSIGTASGETRRGPFSSSMS